MVDERFTRVTEILYPFSGLGKIDKAVLDNAARRGTKVHKICEGIVSGLGDWGVDEETRGYVSSFQKWWEKGHKVISMEERFYCEEFMITGQADLILETDKGATIFDIKTPLKPSKTWPLQGAAYAYMARKKGYNITGIEFLRLDKYGNEPTLYKYDYDLHFDLFVHSFNVYNYFFRKKKNGTPDCFEV